MKTLCPRGVVLSVVIGLATIGCAPDDTTAPTEEGTDDYTATSEALRASTDPNELRLAAVENVVGFGLRAVSVWQRDTENGRDLWLTMPTNGTSRVWKAREDIFSLDGMQYAGGVVKFLFRTHGWTTDGMANSLPVSLRVDLPPEGSTSLTLTREQYAQVSSYTVDPADPTNEPFSSFVGQLEAMTRIENDRHMVRLFTLGSPDSTQELGKRLVLVLTDRDEHHVFPLELRVGRVSVLSFAAAPAGAQQVTFETHDVQDKMTKYAVRWQRAGSPSIRRVP
jgi:hypothetical protein